MIDSFKGKKRLIYDEIFSIREKEGLKKEIKICPNKIERI